MLADLGSARPRLPQVVTKAFDLTSTLRADGQASQIAVITTQQECLHPDRHTSVAEAAPITQSARSERVQHRARSLLRALLAQEPLADHLGAHSKDMDNGGLQETPANGQLRLLMRIPIPAPQQVSPTMYPERLRTSMMMSKC